MKRLGVENEGGETRFLKWKTKKDQRLAGEKNKKKKKMEGGVSEGGR